MKFIKIPNVDYEIMDAPVTQKEWVKVMGNNPSFFKDRPNNPVETVSWNDVQDFIKKLNDKDKKYIYRLPIEKEWEYCCSAGSTTDYSFGDDNKQLDRYAWYCANSKKSTQLVKKKLPNKFGLYDMHGNVWEWTGSFFSIDSSYRVLRGGSWYNDPQDLRSALRSYGRPGDRYDVFGFRLVRTVALGSLTLLSSDARAAQALDVAREALEKIEKILQEKEVK